MHLFRLNDSLTHQCLLNQSAYADDFRLLLVGLLGSTISIISVIENLIIFYVFSTSRKLRRQNYANPVLLALFDIVVSLTYLFLASGHFFAYRLGSPRAVRFWASHMRLVYCVQHVALTISNLLLVVASLERFLANGPLCFKAKKRLLIFMVHHKGLVFTSIILIALLFKATIYLESGVIELPHCGLMDSLIPIWLSSRSHHGDWERWMDWRAVRFWLRKLFTIFVPFLLLAYCNVHIVLHLRERRKETNSASQESRQKAVGDGGGAQMAMGNVLGMGLQKEDQTRCYPCPNYQTIRPKRGVNSLLLLSRPDKNKKCRLPGMSGKNHRNHRHGLAQGLSHPLLTPIPTSPVIDDESTSTMKYNSQQRPSPSASPRPPPFGEKRGVRVATRTLVMVVGCYLISNSMTTIINIWEYLDVRFLRYQHYYGYLIASDMAALLTIVGCALRLPIYVSNDRRIRKAVGRAFLRCRYFHLRFCRPKTPGTRGLADVAAVDVDLEKWSLILVSNSLRSNLTGMLSQVDWATFNGKKSFDQLAVLVQNRRRFLVQMTINLGGCEELPPTPSSTPSTSSSVNIAGGAGAIAFAGIHHPEAATYLTEIQEEGEEELPLIAEEEGVPPPPGGQRRRSMIMTPKSTAAVLVVMEKKGGNESDRLVP